MARSKMMYEVKVHYSKGEWRVHTRRNSRTVPTIKGWHCTASSPSETEDNRHTVLFRGKEDPWEAMYAYIDHFEYMGKKKVILPNFRVELWEYPLSEFSEDEYANDEIAHLLRIYTVCVDPEEQSEEEDHIQEENEQEDQEENNEEEPLLESAGQDSEVDPDESMIPSSKDSYGDQLALLFIRFVMILGFVAISYIVFVELEKSNLVEKSTLLIASFLYICVGALVIVEVFN